MRALSVCSAAAFGCVRRCSRAFGSAESVLLSGAVCVYACGLCRSISGDELNPPEAATDAESGEMFVAGESARDALGSVE